MPHYAFSVGLMVLGLSGAVSAQTSTPLVEEVEKSSRAKIAVAKASRDISEIEDVAILLRGVLAFECKLGDESFPLVLLEKKKRLDDAFGSELGADRNRRRVCF